jgi:methionine salvage enolase-phosphatase E1
VPNESPVSYRKIAQKMDVDCANVTFFSDTEAEIAAASEAGMTAVPLFDEECIFRKLQDELP